jgi:RNA polymerase sigma factor (sigma-70 family)
MKRISYHKDVDLVNAIKGSESERRQALQHFFLNPKLMKWALKYVKVNGGSEQDGKDVFEEAFIIFERQIRTGHYRAESSLETYFHGIVRWQWVAFLRKNRLEANLGNHPETASEDHSPEKILISEERRIILSNLMTQVGERCQKLIGLFQLNYSMREIREMQGYSSDQVAANEVHSCREKLKKVIQKRPDLLDTLKFNT